MEGRRPDPDELLKHVEAEDRAHARGRLKVFLGYAAGVGKTFAMLEAARQRQAEGVDVVVGYVETHGRVETEALLDGLEILPRQSVEYRGALLEDLDLDALLQRHPALALIDELAHTNTPGSRHGKRYQDVLEVLDAGVDVYTTLNVQHLESYKDVVAQITGVVVQETVPDGVLVEGADLELVDLPPQELLRRLQEGKVYVPAAASQALERFFRPGNLAALRELALRSAAHQVDAEMLAYMRARGIPGPWAASERLLVAVGSSPLSQRLVRTAKRMAEELSAEWLALYVETPAIAQNAEARERAVENLNLAENLGATVAMLPGTSVAETLVDYARARNVTKIIAGKPLVPRWQELLRGSLVDQLIRRSGAIDVYVVTSGPSPPRRRSLAPRPASRWRLYLYALPPVLLATLVGWPLRARIEPANLVMLYLAAVILSALFLGRGPAIVSAVASILVFDFFLIRPYLTFAVSDAQYLLTFLGLFVVGLVVSELAARVREQAKTARARELQASDLYELSRELAGAAGSQGIIHVAIDHVKGSLGGSGVVLVPGEGDRLTVALGDDLDVNEAAVAFWAFVHRQAAGKGTDTIPGARYHFEPLLTGEHNLGVIGIELSDGGRTLSPTQRRLLQAYASLTALALERAQLAAEANQLQLLRATEKLQSALLNSISHELRTPLASIAGVLSALRKGHGKGQSGMDRAVEAELVETAWEEADHLNRLVGNLLDMTKLEAGALRVRPEPSDLEDVVGAVLRQLEDRLVDREVAVSIQSSLPLVPLDFVLICHVLANVLDNAIKYSEGGSPIEIAACRRGDEAILTVADRGPGVPPSDLEAVFTKFNRSGRSGEAGGLGLGLSIAKGIVEAHMGRIWAENRTGGGTTICLALPIQGMK